MKDWLSYVDMAQKGDRAAFDRLVGQFGNMAVGYAYSVLGDFHLAEDAAQEAFIEAYYCISKLKEPAAFPAWFRKVIYKYCDRYIRKKHAQTVSLECAAELPSTSESPFDKLQRKEMSDSVAAAIDSLSEKERTAITLVYIGGNSLAQVGSFLNVPTSTIKSRLYSARQRLKERMAELLKDVLSNHAPGDDFSRRISRVLDGIEKIHWSTTSCICFVGSTVACMRYIGENVNNDYVMGISGGAFKLFWYPQWSPANCDLLLYGEEPIRRTFAALGYDYTYISDRDCANPLHPREYYQEKIVKSIDQGRPVIAIGIVGPPECCVVAGYDKSGEILYGRSYFQGNQFGGDNYEQQPAGYFRTDDWYNNFYGCILIGDKKEKPTDVEIMRQTLEWAIKLAREPEFESPGFAVGCDSLSEGSPGYMEGCGQLASQRHISGLAAYDAIIEALGRDEDYPKDDIDILTFRSMALGTDGLALLIGKRNAACQFLKSMADLNLPASYKLSEAADYYERQSKLLQENIDIIPGWKCSPEKMRQLADPTYRRRIANITQKAKALEENAVKLLEDAYAAYSK